MKSEVNIEVLEKTIEMVKKEKSAKEKHIEDLNDIIKLKNQEIKIQKNEINKKKDEATNLVDKKFIGSFLVNYFDVQNSEKVKGELLETLASLLDLQETERVRIGLTKIKATKVTQSESQTQRKKSDLKTMFIDFLKRDD